MSSDPHQGSAPGTAGDFCPQSPCFVPLRNKFLATPLMSSVLITYKMYVPAERTQSTQYTVHSTKYTKYTVENDFFLF